MVDLSPGSNPVKSNEYSGFRVNFAHNFKHILLDSAIDLLDGQRIKLILEEAFIVSKAAIYHAIKV